MKLITFQRAGRTSYGAVKDGGIVDLGARLGRDAPALIDLIGKGLAPRAQEIAAREAADFALEASRWTCRCRLRPRSCASASTISTATPSTTTAASSPRTPACSCASRPRSWHTASR